MEANKAVEKVKGKYSASVLDVITFRGETTIIIKKEKAPEILKYMRDDSELSYDFLTDICGVDYYPRQPRYEVVYNLYSIKNSTRIRVKVPLDAGDEKIPSVVSLYLSPPLECVFLQSGLQGH